VEGCFRGVELSDGVDQPLVDEVGRVACRERAVTSDRFRLNSAVAVCSVCANTQSGRSSWCARVRNVVGWIMERCRGVAVPSFRTVVSKPSSRNFALSAPLSRLPQAVNCPSVSQYPTQRKTPLAPMNGPLSVAVAPTASSWLPVETLPCGSPLYLCLVQPSPYGTSMI
jgi:hypothetical protein